jgi:hypothetical protein
METPDDSTPFDAFAKRLRMALGEHFASRDVLQGYNFENLLGAIEALEDYAWDRSLISRVTIFGAEDAILRDRMLLSQARFALVKAIHREVGEAVTRLEVREHPDSVQVRRLLERLARTFRLVVIDLNYDDIADDAQVRWSDGFTKPLEAEALAFDPQQWNEDVRDGRRHLLIHLHGSVRFGQRPLDKPGIHPIHSMDEPVKYPSYAIAKDHTDAQSASGPYSVSYVISGIGKGAKIVYNLRPYGHYLGSLMQLVLQADALLTMGYGWADSHVNVLLGEFVELRSRAPVASITLRSMNDVRQNLPSEQSFLRIAEREWVKFTWAYCEQTAEPKHRSWLGGRLLLLPYGIPLCKADITAVLRHLRGKNRSASRA